tara:strand:- start:501 stop:707 length:207 start_codon:yes stop_codon:yes gene_type:complete
MAKKKTVSKKAKAVKKVEKKVEKKKVVAKEPKKEEPKQAVVELKLDRDSVQTVYVKPKHNYLKAQGVK